MQCVYCQDNCTKRGKRNGKQSYQCKTCRKYQQDNYSKVRILQEKYQLVHRLNNEGCGKSSIGRLLTISKSSVLRIIMRLAKSISRPEIIENNESYEMVELCTYCGNKKHESWIIYAINKKTRRIVDFYIGRRTKENIRKVVDNLLKLNPKKIYTDGLNIYQSPIKEQMHIVYKGCTNHIERKNLTIRMHLKRLNRKTICFSKSEVMLERCFYLWFCA